MTLTGLNMTKMMVVTALALISLAGCNKKADNDDGQTMVMAEPAEYTPTEKAAIQASFPAPYNAADLVNGEKQFMKCRACHTITSDKMNMTGPHLYGLFGRKSGTEPGYTYSDAMIAHNTVWDFASLDTYLESPQAVVKGTKMSYPGIADTTQRRDLIAYLKLETTPRGTASATSASAP